MSAAIGPGDWVECVKARFDLPTGERLVRGNLYVVTEVDVVVSLCGCSVCGSTEEHLGVNVNGIIDPDNMWCGGLFRPIYRPSESKFLERLMNVPTSPELEPA